MRSRSSRRSRNPAPVATGGPGFSRDEIVESSNSSGGQPRSGRKDSIAVRLIDRTTVLGLLGPIHVRIDGLSRDAKLLGQFRFVLRGIGALK